MNPKQLQRELLRMSKKDLQTLCKRFDVRVTKQNGGYSSKKDMVWELMGGATTIRASEDDKELIERISKLLPAETVEELKIKYKPGLKLFNQPGLVVPHGLLPNISAVQQKYFDQRDQRNKQRHMYHSRILRLAKQSKNEEISSIGKHGERLLLPNTQNASSNSQDVGGRVTREQDVGGRVTREQLLSSLKNIERKQRRERLQQMNRQHFDDSWTGDGSRYNVGSMSSI